MTTLRHPASSAVFRFFAAASLCCLGLALEAQSGASSLVLPSELRQGDPLLVWFLMPLADPEGSRNHYSELPGGDSPALSHNVPADSPAPPPASLVDIGGRVVGRVSSFDATALFAAMQTELAGPEAASHPRVLVYAALLAIPPSLAPGSYTVEIGTQHGSVEVRARTFPVETIKLSASMSKLKAVQTPRQKAESEELYKLLVSTDPQALFADGAPFLLPAEGFPQSAGFGDKRKYLYSDGKSDLGIHEGVDFAVPVKTELRACESGKVVLAEDRELTGTTLVIEHLPGLYSLYFHLSSIEVKLGQLVSRGQPVAHSGSTGLVTGPHLHWQINVNGEEVDPLFWASRPLLDKDAIKTKMDSLIEGR